MLPHGWRPRRRVSAAAVTLALLMVVGPGAGAVVSGGGTIPYAATGDVVVQRGDHNATVAAVQQALLNAGITVRGGADGIFGPATQAAVTEFQTRKGLTASGVVNTATAVALGVVPATPILARGAHSTAVATMQQQLLDVGVSVRGGADGWFGSGTEAAVRQFQVMKGLTATGQLDAATAEVLANAAAGVGGGTPAAPSPAPSPGTPATPALPQQGSRGDAVKAFQQELIAVGLRPKGGADGIYGPATATALATFQQRAGLPATGVYDQATATALTAAATAARNGSTGTPGGPSGTNADGSVTLANFPMPQRCTFWDTWGAPRSGGRTHQGVDILAPTGTPIYAVQGGTITKIQTDYKGSLAGNAIWLTAPDGTYFFYAHLSAFASGVAKGTRVNAGATIGYVGSTGNAGVPHLHFEVHPRGGNAVNPYPIVKPVSGC